MVGSNSGAAIDQQDPNHVVDGDDEKWCDDYTL
jgi:hypothetical protein